MAHYCLYWCCRKATAGLEIGDRTLTRHAVDGSTDTVMAALAAETPQIVYLGKHWAVVIPEAKESTKEGIVMTPMGRIMLTDTCSPECKNPECFTMMDCEARRKISIDQWDRYVEMTIMEIDEFVGAHSIIMGVHLPKVLLRGLT